jgi:hypothetical protein
LDALPHTRKVQASVLVSGVQPHTPGVPPPPHVFGLLQLQVTEPPQPSERVPQLVPVQGFEGVQPHFPGVPPPPQVLRPVHPQDTEPPHESVSVPQLTPSHGLPLGVHPQVFGLPPPPHVLGAVHVLPQSTLWPQLLVVTPHATLLQVTLFASSTQLHTEGGPPTQLSPAAHAVQRPTSPQPCVVSVGTHDPEQALVPGPQLPSTQLEPLHTTVPVFGHVESSQVVGPHP